MDLHGRQVVGGKTLDDLWHCRPRLFALASMTASIGMSTATDRPNTAADGYGMLHNPQSTLGGGNARSRRFTSKASEPHGTGNRHSRVV
jgi:hypothetical protein